MDFLRYPSERYEDNSGNCQVIINSIQTSGSRMGSGSRRHQEGRFWLLTYALLIIFLSRNFY